MKKFIKEIVPYIVIIIVVIIVKKYVVTPIKVNGPSMNNTLKDGDIMILNELSHNYNRFDIVVLKYNDELIIKRIIGLPGEELSYIDNKLYINGKYIKEDFNHSKTDNIEKLKIEKDSYFVMGDNRIVSNDSRYIGTFNKKDIIGKTKLTIYPFNRFGIKK